MLRTRGKGKVWMAALLSMVTILSLTTTACGNATGAAASNASGTSKDTGDTIKVGFMSNQSGDNAVTTNIEAFEMAVDEINAAGGVLGKQLEPVEVDCQSDTQKFQTLAQQLILDDNCDIVFMNATSANREAARPVFERNKKLLIYDGFYEGGVASRYTLCTAYTPEQAILPLLKYIHDNNLGNKVYVLAADYNYGQICAQWVQEYCDQLGMEVSGTEFVPLGTSQFSSSISKIQNSGANVVFTLLVGAAQESFFDQWASAGITGVQLASSINIGYSYEHKKVAAPGLAGMLASSNFFEEMDTDAAKKFVDDFRERYPKEPYVVNDAEASYTGVYLWKAAVEKAGTTDNEAVIDAFETGDISFDAPSGKVTVDGATHHCSLSVSIAQVQKDHSLKIVEHLDDVQPTYLKDLGVDIRKNDPKKQYSPLEDGTGNK
jgi:urea ABC transporter substrate-binding protein